MYFRRTLFSVMLLFVASCAVSAQASADKNRRPAQPVYPAPTQGDFVIRDFHFRSGEVLPELRLHYATLGAPMRDRSGVVRNAVLIMHGTGGAGGQFLTPQFAGVLFGPGQLLDATRYFIILPDGIGHGKSGKPSDGLRARFPRYTYDDMVAAQYRLLTEKLGVGHLRLVMGTSMGGMQTWVWGETYPDFMDALMPLASLPVEIAGRNRVMRRMLMDAIRKDPAWDGGDYKSEPQQGLTAAVNILLLMGSSPLQWQKQSPTREAADKFYEERLKAQLAHTDANDMLYQFDASREYDPAPKLETIKAPLVAINSADDLINPPELGIMEREIKRVTRGRYVLIPVSDETRGHGTHSLPAVWQQYLRELLDVSKSDR
jgi:homoserine O-acetyltransferase